jgi:hypothetical protein
MGVSVLRGTAFVLAMALSAPVLGEVRGPLKPSARALAVADEPPPHADPRAVKPPPTQVTVVQDDTPVYKKWWFWALTAAVVGGTVAFGALTFTPAEPRPRACPPATRLCFGDGRPQ